MNLLLLNTNFEVIDVIDTYTSLLWTVRYDEAGEFELIMPANNHNLELFKLDYYLQNLDSDRLMIIEKKVIETDVESGNELTITGRTLESILNRRIIWVQTTISGNLQNAVKKLINDAIISPSDSSRKISNFIFEDNADTAITNLTIDESQYTGDNLYDIIHTICELKHIGFKVTLNSAFQFVFKLYAGIDRSYSQTTLPCVVFSNKFENLLSSNYSENKTNYKNVTLVGGEGEGTDRTTATYGTESGLARRELFTDARDLSTNDGEIDATTYQNQLIERGTEKLKNYEIVKDIDGEIVTTNLYTLNEDYSLGDVVQVVDSYGTEAKSRITEVVTSISASSQSTYPTFEIEDDD